MNLKLFLLLLLIPCVALAWGDTARLPDAQQESRAQSLFGELRCVVCEGQTLADSGSPLAASMRLEIRQLVAAGKSDQEVRDYFAALYGDSILLTPPLTARNLLLWLMPLLLFGIGAGMIWRRRRS